LQGQTGHAAEKELPLGRAVVLHLLPGAVQMGVYAALTPPLVRAGAPPTLAFVLAAVLAGLPCMLALLAAPEGPGRGLAALRRILRRQQPMPLWLYAALFVPLLALAFALLFATVPLCQFMAAEVFFWLPEYLLPSGRPPVPPDRALLLLALLLQLVVDGVVAPLVEEVYFRGFLLPRLAYLGRVAPAINALLFTLQHFWQPYNWVLIFLLNLPLAYVVWWRRNIIISILLHCSTNTLGASLALIEFFSS
jgi:membrane protease YdiL (CAAX protease family)